MKKGSLHLNPTPYTKASPKPAGYLQTALSLEEKDRTSLDPQRRLGWEMRAGEGWSPAVIAAWPRGWTRGRPHSKLVGWDGNRPKAVQPMLVQARQWAPWKGWNHQSPDGISISVLRIPCGSAGKESACNVGDLGSIPGLGQSPGEGKGYPLRNSGLENSMNYIVHGAAKSWARLNNFHFHT